MHVSNNGFVFCTWNIANVGANYHQMIKERTAEEMSIDYPRELKEGEERTPLGKVVNISELNSNEYNTLENARAKLLNFALERLMENNSVDALAIQEVNSKKEIEHLEKQGFKVIMAPKEKIDTLIALNPKKFINIDNRSFVTKSGDFAVAVATEKKTGKKIAFVSAHPAGFDLKYPQDSLKDAAESGDLEVKTLMYHIKTNCHDCDTVLIGADVNSIPEVYNERFDLFEDAGFQLVQTNNPTSILESFPARLKERGLDFVFISQRERRGFFALLKKLFGKSSIHVIEALKDQSDLPLDPLSSPFDHLPVITRVHCQNVSEVSRFPKR